MIRQTSAEQRCRSRCRQLPSRASRWTHRCDRPGHARQPLGRAAHRVSRDQGVQQHPRQEPSPEGRSERNERADRSLGLRRFAGRHVGSTSFSSTISASTLSTLVIWTNPAGNSPERRPTATILTPLLSGARSPKPTEAGSLNTAPNGKLRSEGISQRRPQPAQRVNEASSMIGTVVNMSPAGRELTPQCCEGIGDVGAHRCHCLCRAVRHAACDPVKDTF